MQDLQELDHAVTVNWKKDQLSEATLEAMKTLVRKQYEQIRGNHQQDGAEHQPSEVELDHKITVEEHARRAKATQDDAEVKAAIEDLERRLNKTETQYEAGVGPKPILERIYDVAIARGRSQSRSRSRSRGRRSSPVQLGLPSQPPVTPGQEGPGPRIEEVEERLRSEIKLGEVKPNEAQGANWTKISCEIVNPEVLVIGKERFEVQDDFVIVLRALSKEEIQAYASATVILRGIYFFSICCCSCRCCKLGGS